MTRYCYACPDCGDDLDYQTTKYTGCPQCGFMPAHSADEAVSKWRGPIVEPTHGNSNRAIFNFPERFADNHWNGLFKPNYIDGFDSHELPSGRTSGRLVVTR